MINDSNINTYLIFTDLDGTFLSNDDFSFGDNIKLTKKLISLGHFVIVNSSKTFAEIHDLLSRNDLLLPIICETGGGIYLPKDELNITGQAAYDNYIKLFEAPKISDIQERLTEILSDFVNDFDFFDDLKEKNQEKLSNLRGNGLILASERVFTKLIVWRNNQERLMKLTERLKNNNLNLVKGARFCHLCSNFSKGKSMNYLVSYYRKLYRQQSFNTIALGDSSNDIDMLKQADLSCIVNSMGNETIRDEEVYSKSIKSISPAPNGWNECIRKIINLGDS